MRLSRTPALIENLISTNLRKKKMEMKEIQEAIARGWCSPRNKKKTMDVDLALAISVEVKKLFVADKTPKLGCATTGQLLDEIKARITLDCKLDYRTIDTIDIGSELDEVAQEAKTRADAEGIDATREQASN